METQQEEMNKRFDEWFTENQLILRHKNVDEAHEMYKSFLQSEISQAVAQREKKIVELANQFLNAWGDEIYPANEFINLITKPNDK